MKQLKLSEQDLKDMGYCKHEQPEKQCFKCHPRACDKCKKCQASLIWTGEGGVLAYTHGWTQSYCKCCATKEQLAYAQEAAKRISKLKKEAKKRCKPASKELQTEAVRKNTHHLIKRRCEKCGKESGSGYMDGERDPGEGFPTCLRELNPPPLGQGHPRTILKEERCGGKMIVIEHRTEVR